MARVPARGGCRVSLTVPRAGLSGGRAANAAGMPVAEPVVGDLLAGLGNSILEKQAKVRAERDQLALQQANLDMARDLGQARLEADQLTDPDQLDQTWQQRSQEIYANRVETIKDPELRKKAQLSWQEMNDRQSLAVGQRAVSLTQSQRGAQWVEMKTQITAEAATADPETFGIYLDQGLAVIDARLAVGDLTPERAATDRQALKADMYSSRAAQAISADPEAFLAAAETGAFNELGGDRLTDFRLAAQREVKRREDAAIKVAEAAATQRAKAIDDRLDVMTSLMLDGFSVEDEAALKDPEVQARPKFAAALAAQSLRNEMPNIKQMTPQELRAAIAAERAAPKAHKYQAQRVAVLSKWEEEASKLWNTDAATAAQKAGLPIPALPAFDPANADAFAAGLGQRLGFDAHQRGKGYSQGQAVLSAEEKAQLKAVIAPEADVAPKVALAEAIIAGTAGKPAAVTRIIEADPVFRRATSLLGQTGDRALVAQMLEGQQKEKLGTISLPPKPQRQLILADVLGSAYAGMPAQEAEIMEAASALYAADAAGINPDGEQTIFKDDTEAQDLFRTAVKRVTGATADRNGDLTIGGLQEVNGASVILPAGVPVADVERAWDVVDTHLRGGVWSEQYQSTDFSDTNGADPLRSLKAASIDQSAPDLGPDAYARWRDAKPVRVGDSDVYELVIERGGRTYKVPRAEDAQGRAWRFRMTDLIRGAAQ